MSRNASQQKYIRELQKIREQIIEQKTGEPIESLIQKLKICHDVKIKSLAIMIEKIFNTNTKSYSISTNITKDINNLETISIPNDDLTMDDVKNINKLIDELKQTVNGNDNSSKLGLSNSYLMILNSIIKYAEKIKCPPKKANIENIIEYFSGWRKIQINKWKKGRNKEVFKMSEVIFPVYIITKIILHTNLYKETQHDRQANFNFRLNQYLINKRKDQPLNDDVFIRFIILYLKKIVKYTNNNIQFNIGITKKDKEEFLTFINNFETVLDYLSKVKKQDFDKHLTNGTSEIKSFKQDFYDMILNRGYDGVGKYFRFGTKYQERKGFRIFYEKVLKRKLLKINVPNAPVPSLYNDTQINRNRNSNKNTSNQPVSYRNQSNPDININTGIDLSSLGPGFLDRNRQINRETKARSFNNNEKYRNNPRYRGGNKTKKKKHKKMITRKNRKKNHRKKNYNKNKYTKQNKNKYNKHKTIRKKLVI